MVTSPVINKPLLKRALRVGGLKSEKETVNTALKEFIEKRAKEDVVSMFGTVDYDKDYDYKNLRGKR